MNGDKVLGGILGLAIGDALGVPVEFESREVLDKNPVKSMKGYGTYNQPPGTWSDDTSLALATINALIEGKNNDNDFLKRIGANFVSWLYEAKFTPHAEVFDIGNTTHEAINNLRKGIKPELCGINRDFAQANGSLMRILPASLYFINKYEDDVYEILKKVHSVSSITHSHPSCLIACGIYTLFIKYILEGKGLLEAYKETCVSAITYYQKLGFSERLHRFKRLLSGRIMNVEKKKINSSGYVIDSIEASFWATLTTNSFSEAVLKAVNLGDDTDTIGAITGGLVGLYYGRQAIPEEWVIKLVKSSEIIELAKRFVSVFET